MRRTHAIRLSALCLSLALTAAVGGCASHQAAQHASMGVMGAPATLSLGAGDTLGRAVYVNDLILAAAALDKTTTFTNVDEDAAQLLMDK
jgi:hypothetical protein